MGGVKDTDGDCPRARLYNRRSRHSHVLAIIMALHVCGNKDLAHSGVDTGVIRGLQHRPTAFCMKGVCWCGGRAGQGEHGHLVWCCLPLS